MDCYGRQRLIRNRGWARARILDELVNAIVLGGEIPICALRRTKGIRLREIWRVTAMDKLKRN